MLSFEIEPGAGSVVESAGSDRLVVPFTCVLDILFLILVGVDWLSTFKSSWHTSSVAVLLLTKLWFDPANH